MKNQQVDIAEMARTLQRIPRYNGHSNFEWTVAQHSLLVQRILKDSGYQTDIQLAGLLHDAQEAFINDVIRPIKCHLQQYFVYEAKVENQILHKLGLNDLEEYPEYKEADDLALYAEQVILVGLDNDWVRTYDNKFNDPKVMQYAKFIKPENSCIVMGKFLSKLFELLLSRGFEGLDEKVRQQDWYRELYKYKALNYKEHRDYDIESETSKISVVPFLGLDNKVHKIQVLEDQAILQVNGKKYEADLCTLDYVRDLEAILEKEDSKLFKLIFRPVRNSNQKLK